MLFVHAAAPADTPNLPLQSQQSRFISVYQRLNHTVYSLSKASVDQLQGAAQNMHTYEKTLLLY